MSYLRVEYDGYLEDEFEDRDEAIEKFLEMLQDVDKNNITVEEWNQEEYRWE